MITGIGRSIGGVDNNGGAGAATAATGVDAVVVGAKVVDEALFLTKSGIVLALRAINTSPFVTRPPLPLPCRTVASLPLDSARWRAEGNNSDGAAPELFVGLVAEIEEGAAVAVSAS